MSVEYTGVFLEPPLAASGGLYLDKLAGLGGGGSPAACEYSSPANFHSEAESTNTDCTPMFPCTIPHLFERKSMPRNSCNKPCFTEKSFLLSFSATSNGVASSVTIRISSAVYLTYIREKQYERQVIKIILNN
jgi:hypothetical protein